MIKFVVCDDKREFIDKVSFQINKVLLNNDLEYEINEFQKFDKTFEKIINDEMSSKIYILDIELPGISGIDIARKIRRIDWNSIIIMVTSHSELGYEALKAQIMLLDFISKFDNCEKNLEKVLKRAISKINAKKVISFESLGVLYRIYLDDILYVVKDTVDRKCIIKTSYNEVSVNKTMLEMVDELDERFYMSHRSCLVNTEKIRKIDLKNNIIYFKNGDSIDLISRDRKRGLKEYVELG